MRTCPRLTIYTETVDGRTHERKQCNQHMPDCSVWWDDVKNVTKERCKELRAELEKKREVQVRREENEYRERLQEEFNEQKNDIYNKGVEHGRNLLFQLNNGEISLDDFSKRIKKY